MKGLKIVLMSIVGVVVVLAIALVVFLKTVDVNRFQKDHERDGQDDHNTDDRHQNDLQTFHKTPLSDFNALSFPARLSFSHSGRPDVRRPHQAYLAWNP